MCGPRADLEHHYAGAGSGRVAKHLAKITIQRDERRLRFSSSLNLTPGFWRGRG
jgi:hypothetical protein